MMLDLTKQYSALFRKQGGKMFFLFARDVFKSGKLRELSSFIVWELLHQLRLFPKSKYIQFRQGQHLALDNQAVSSDEFHAQVVGFFASKGLSAQRCSTTWKLLFRSRRGEIFGCAYPEDRDLYKSVDNGESLVFLKRFPDRIKAIFVSSAGTILVCVPGFVYRSSDEGLSFQKVLDFASSDSFFRFNNAMTELPDKTLIMGEYGNVWDENGWRKLAYLYYSSDEGETWEKSDFLIKQGTNKHVHVVKYSPLLDRLLVADGDNYKKLWISRPLPKFNLHHPQFRAVNRFHIQIGGHTSATESEGTILFGTDYQGGTNFIVQTADGVRFPSRIVPDPYRRSPIDNMVPRKAKHGTEVWANLPFSTAKTKCLLMFTTDNGATWNKVIDYDGAAYKVWLLNAADGVSETVYFSVQDLRNNDRVVYEIADHR